MTAEYAAKHRAADETPRIAQPYLPKHDGVLVARIPYPILPASEGLLSTFDYPANVQFPATVRVPLWTGTTR